MTQKADYAGTEVGAMAVVFRAEGFGDALRTAAAWMDDHYAEANPLAVNLTWTDDEQWEVLLVAEPSPNEQVGTE
jgi:hypothetical protein